MRPTIGSWRQRLKHRLGFCWSCWRRGTMTADLAGYDRDGNQTGEPTRYSLCMEHALDWSRAVMSVPHTGSAEFTNGRTVAWTRADIGEDAYAELTDTIDPGDDDQ